LSGQLFALFLKAFFVSSLQVNINNSVATIVIARQEKRNALDTATWQLLAEACEFLAPRADINVIVLSGDGEHFSAGADIHELRANITDATWLKHNQASIARALDAYAALPQPTIAKIRGACIGGGAALAAASDFRYCTADTRLAITPAKLGLTYRLVDCLRIVDLIGAAHARELLLMARECDAATALTWGFINEVIDADVFEAEVNAKVAQLASLSSTSQRGIKSSLLKIRAGQCVDDAESIATFQNAFTGADFQEGAAAFIEKRAATF
jgi:enoyl-CoA hydratase